MSEYVVTPEERDALVRELIEHALKTLTIAGRLGNTVYDPRGPLGKAVAYGIEHLHGADSFQAKVAHALTNLPVAEPAAEPSDN